MPNGPKIELLVEEHYVSLYRFAYRLSGSQVDAEDLTQETFCKAQSNLNQLRELSKARGWLFSILRNAFLHRTRTERRKPMVSLEYMEDIAEPSSDALPEIDSDELQKALQELPEEFRTPVILFYFEDFSYREISEQMELPIGTVMSRLSRAKTYLRQKFITPDAALLGVDPETRSRRTEDGL